MIALRSLTIALLAHPLSGAVAGAPEPGPTGTLPDATFTSGNDLFGNGLGNGDDFRSASIGGHARLGPLIVATDAALLTDRVGRTRSDELVAVVGLAWGPEVPRTGWHAGGFAGLGLRLDGDLGGEDVQNSVHRVINADEVHLPYDRHDRLRPAATASAALGWLGPAGLGLTGWWGAQVVAAGQYAVEGEAIAEIGPRLSLVGRDGVIWVGAFMRLREGDPPTATVAATGEHEDGWWLDSGTWITPLRIGSRELGWQIRASLNPETRATLGSIGLILRPEACPAGAELALEHDLAVFTGGGFGVQLRWHPYPWQDVQRSALVGDYHFGTEPEGRLSLDSGPSGARLGADLRHDQWTVGWEEAWRSPDWSGFRFVPWMQAGAGLRLEGVVAEADRTRLAGERAIAPVARAGLGVRVTWRDLFSLGTSLDGWLPAWRERLRDGDDILVLNDPGWALGLHLAAHVAW